MSDLGRQIEEMRSPLKEPEVKALCLKAMEILVEERNVQRVDAPVTFYDMKELFKVGGDCPKTFLLLLALIEACQVSALIENRIFSVHAWWPLSCHLHIIGPDDRKQEVRYLMMVPYMCDLLWSDPEDIVDGCMGFKPSRCWVSLRGQRDHGF